MDLLIYSDLKSARLQYVCQQVVNRWCGLAYTMTTQREEYLQYDGVRINYSRQKLTKKEFFIPRSTFLSEKAITPLELSVVQYNKIPALFPVQKTVGDIPFDLFATIFFHLSRYEEYLAFEPDKYDRFTASQSWSYQNACLDIPICDLLIKAFYNQLQKCFPSLPTLKRQFKKLPTYDVDMAWAYKNKGTFRSLGGLLKQLKAGEWKLAKKRINTLLNRESDPFFTFEQLKEWNTKYNIQPIYFFLLGKYSTYDKNISPGNKEFQALIQNIAKLSSVGIHPSYQSNDQPQRLPTEIQRLQSIIKKEITQSRQHFLKLHLPITYRNLLKQGIEADYSMGYAEQIGFRAGTSLPFYWYDLEKEESTNLKIYPFQIMDVTLKEYLKLTPTEAKAAILAMIQTIRSVDGIFCSLWHNSSFSYIDDWEEWKDVYEYLLEM